MDKQEAIEGNKIIAGFIGWTFEIIPDEYGGELIAYYEGKSRWRGERPDYLDQMMSSENGYAFHCDWNKLMPVVEKIEQAGANFTMGANSYVDMTVPKAGSEMKDEFDFFEFHVTTEADPVCGKFNSHIEAVWLCAIQFIKWYNSQKQ